MKTTSRIGNNTRLISDGELNYIQFECFDKFDGQLIHCLSTRLGGVSQGECHSLNLGFNRNDSSQNVRTNYDIICKSLGIDSESLVFSNQVHDDKIKIVDYDDRGKGFCKKSDIIGYDGLVTDSRDVTMVTFYADCVPIFLYEESKKVAALLHSGWRSTLKGIGDKAVQVMIEKFGCSEKGIVAAIGPSIGKCCFEVGAEVYYEFKQKYDEECFYNSIGAGKWKIDLQGIIESMLLKAGLRKNNIYQSGICTKCNNNLFYSHRGDAGKTGSLAAFMQLK